jgi:mannose PTS system EIIA component
VTKLVVMAHAPLATALLAVAAHAYPEAVAELSAIDVRAGDSLDQAEGALKSVLDACSGSDEVLVMADVFGATPCNAAMRVADGVRVRVVCGVNVPMLWRALCYSRDSVDKLVVRATEGATQGVLQVSAARRQNQGVAAHAAKLGHDQQ